MTNREKYLDKTLKETLDAFNKESDNLDILGWLTKDDDAQPNKASASPECDLGAKIGLAMLPLAGLAAGGKMPSINVWVITNGK